MPEALRRCADCGGSFLAENFYRASRGLLECYCKSCHGKREVKRRSRQRIEALRHYSPGLTCVRCGFSETRALVFDHIDGNGNQHRKLFKGGIVGWLRRNNYPVGIQVLCHNCNFLKRLENHEHGVRRARVNS